MIGPMRAVELSWQILQTLRRAYRVLNSRPEHPIKTPRSYSKVSRRLSSGSILSFGFRFPRKSFERIYARILPWRRGSYRFRNRYVLYTMDFPLLYSSLQAILIIASTF